MLVHIFQCKGFGPRNGLSLPMSSKGVGFIYDTLKFATPISDRVVRDPIKRVPHLYVLQFFLMCNVLV